MSSNPTARQKQILEYIGQHRTRHGVPPTVREIQSHFGFASPNAAASHLRALEKKHLLKREPGSARALRVTGDNRREVAGLPVASMPIWIRSTSGERRGPSPCGSAGIP